MNKVYVVVQDFIDDYYVYTATTDKVLAEAVYEKLKAESYSPEYLDILEFDDEHALSLL